MQARRARSEAKPSGGGPLQGLQARGALRRIAVLGLAALLLGTSGCAWLSQVRSPFLMMRAKRMVDEGRFDDAAQAAAQALAIEERAHGPDHAHVASYATGLALIYLPMGRMEEAEALLERALRIREATLGPDDPKLAETLLVLAIVAQLRVDLERAIELARRAIDIQERAFGPESSQVAISLASLGEILRRYGDYEGAEQAFQRSLSIHEAEHGPDHVYVADVLQNLAQLYREIGDPARAEQLYARSMAIAEHVFGPEHPMLTTRLMSQASFLKEQGDLAGAEALLRRTLAIQEKAWGPESPLVATTLHNLADLHQALGDDETAEALYERSLQIQARTFGEGNPLMSTTLMNLGNLLARRGEYARADALHERVLAQRLELLGPEHPDVAMVLSNMAYNLDARGEHARAIPLHERSLAIREKVFGPVHPSVATSLHNLAWSRFALGDAEGAEALFERALAIRGQVLGPRHPVLAPTLASLAVLHHVRGDHEGGRRLRERALALEEEQLGHVLALGSERRRRLYLSALLDSTHRTVSEHVLDAPEDPEALRLAFETVLRRKGRELDASADSVARLRNSVEPEDRVLFDRWNALRARMAELALAGRAESTSEDVGAQLAELTRQADELETELSTRSRRFAERTRPVTLDALRGRIPEDGALVEVFYWVPLEPVGDARPARYVAYVLRAGAPPRFVDLGPAEAIDTRAATLRDELATPLSRRYREAARALDALVLEPLAAALGDARHLLVAADGALQLVPFGALVDGAGEDRLASLTFSYLTTGRDLLTTPSAQRSGAPWVVAAPLFETGDPEAPDAGVQVASRGVRSRDLAGLRFTPLPGTRAEADALAAMLPGARIVTGAEATEASLKHAASPAILHVATHGFFLADRSPEARAGEAERGLALAETREPVLPVVESPLLRSGLALAGANQRSDGAGEDGILTALELAGLDLEGTQLVVLSACETGVGEARNGEGIFGLRRALVLAGAESQVMSLWKVDDQATQELVVAYYRRLLAGEGRAAGLRQARLEMRRRRPHPYYWASFVPLGAWGPIRLPEAAP